MEKNLNDPEGFEALFDALTPEEQMTFFQEIGGVGPVESVALEDLEDFGILPYDEDEWEPYCAMDCELCGCHGDCPDCGTEGEYPNWDGANDHTDLEDIEGVTFTPAVRVKYIPAPKDDTEW